jgi:hypothetical protein
MGPWPAELYKNTGDLERCSCCSATTSAVRYLGIAVDDVLGISGQVDDVRREI